MTVRQNSMNDPDEKWAVEKMSKERRRLRTIGIAVLVAAALATAAIMYYFGSFATTGW